MTKKPTSALRRGAGPKVFISHDHRDARLAEALDKLIRETSSSQIEVFRSSHYQVANWSIEFGQNWFQSILENIEEADLVIALLTRRSLNRPWLVYETGVARGVSFGKRSRSCGTVPLLINVQLSEISESPFKHIQACSFKDSDLRHLVDRLIAMTNLKPGEDTIAYQISRFVDTVKEQVRIIDRECPLIGGDWNYRVVTADGGESHSGTCAIVDAGEQLHFNGTRTSERSQNTPDGMEVHRRWKSTWAEKCQDGKIRFFYEVDLREGRARAVCILDVCQSLNGTICLDGEYFLLPPFSDSTLNARHGSIMFTRAETHGSKAPVERESETA